MACVPFNVRFVVGRDALPPTPFDVSPKQTYIIVIEIVHAERGCLRETCVCNTYVSRASRCSVLLLVLLDHPVVVRNARRIILR